MLHIHKSCPLPIPALNLDFSKDRQCFTRAWIFWKDLRQQVLCSKHQCISVQSSKDTIQPLSVVGGKEYHQSTTGPFTLILCTLRAYYYINMFPAAYLPPDTITKSTQSFCISCEVLFVEGKGLSVSAQNIG